MDFVGCSKVTLTNCRMNLFSSRFNSIGTKSSLLFIFYNFLIHFVVTNCAITSTIAFAVGRLSNFSNLSYHSLSQSCPEGPPSQWETHLDAPSKAYLAPIVFNGKLISISEDKLGKIEASFRVVKPIKNIGSTIGTVPVNLLKGSQVTLYFVKHKNLSSISPFCAVYLKPSFIDNLKPGQKYILFASPPLTSLIDLQTQTITERIKMSNTLRTFNRHTRHSSSISSSVNYNYLSAFATPELHNKRRVRAVRKTLCKGCANAPKVKGLNGDYTIHLKEKLRLTCNVTGNPSPWIVWFRNRKRLKNNKRISIVNTKRGLSHLEIQKVNQKDTGYYECRAMNVVAQEPAIGKVRVIVTIFNSFENKIKSTTTSSPATFNPLQGRPCPMASFCLNGATCTMESTYGEYVCHCAEGFVGLRCGFKDVNISNK